MSAETAPAERHKGEGLLPCPFCGEQPSTYEGRFASSVKRDNGHAIHVYSNDNLADAIAGWNTRLAATPTALPSAEDALREALEPFAEYADMADAFELADDDYLDRVLLTAGDYRRVRAALQSPRASDEVRYDERVEYEERILAAEMQSERLKRTLKPFADKADKWEANHAHTGRDSTQVQHRLGDFRAARIAIEEATNEG